MKAFAAIAAALVLAAGCRMETKTTTETTADSSAHQADVQAWKERRATRLKAEDGWLSLVGLHWLKDGENDVALANGTTVKLTIANGQTTLLATPPMMVDGKPIEGPSPLLADADEKGPTIVQMGSVRFNVIKRGERHALRVKDSQAETRTHFAGLEYFPLDPKWRVEARFEPYSPVKKIPITDITGMTSESDAPGALVFTIDGQEHRLDPVLEEGSDELFIIFKDATSRDATYPAGRYLYAKKPGPDGKVIVDFNKAYNPPCAFTPFATCPLPPLQNRLPIRVEAGEKKYALAH